MLAGWYEKAADLLLYVVKPSESPLKSNSGNKVKTRGVD